MCSDGLNDLILDSNIESSLRELSSNLGAAAGHLVNLANASGGKDNISAVLCKVCNSFPDKMGWSARRLVSLTELKRSANYLSQINQ